MITENVEQGPVLEALRVVQDPDLGRDIINLNFVKDLRAGVVIPPCYDPLDSRTRG